jgi:hypothetical protein
MTASLIEVCGFRAMASGVKQASKAPAGSGSIGFMFFNQMIYQIKA